MPLTELPTDLERVSTTPNYVFITPNLCEDGHDAPCVDGRPGGLASADLFLQEWVPQIVGSRAFRHRGLLIVTFDEGEVSGSGFDSSACCNEPSGPNTAAPGVTGPGGGRVGAVLVSRFIRPGSVNDTPYNHYALLRSIEDLFQLGHVARRHHHHVPTGVRVDVEDGEAVGFPVHDVQRLVGLAAGQDAAEHTTVGAPRRRLDVLGAPPGPQPLQRRHRCSATSSRCAGCWRRKHRATPRSSMTPRQPC